MRAPPSIRPAGTVEIPRVKPFGRPFGAWLFDPIYPRLKPWAIVNRPSGTRAACAPSLKRRAIIGSPFGTV